MFVFHCDSSASLCVCGWWAGDVLHTELIHSVAGTAHSLFFVKALVFTLAGHLLLCQPHMPFNGMAPTKYRHTSLCLWFEELRRSLEAETRTVHLSLCFVVVVLSPRPPRPHTPHSVVCRLSQWLSAATDSGARNIYIFLSFIPMTLYCLKYFPQKPHSFKLVTCLGWYLKCNIWIVPGKYHDAR